MAWNIVPEIPMFHLEHFVAGPAPWSWNRPFLKSVHQVSRKIAEIGLFQIRIRLPALSMSKSRLLYTSMTLPPGRHASNPVRWFTHEPVVQA